jgi:Flp pilus assembly protein TadG
MVEFAIIAVPLLLLVMGMLQFGVILNAKINEVHLASSGARYAAVNQNPGDAEDLTLQEYIKQRADTDDMRQTATVCVDFPTGSSEVGDPVRVTMSYSYDLLPILDLGDAITVEGDATMRLEALPDAFSEECSA